MGHGVKSIERSVGTLARIILVGLFMAGPLEIYGAPVISGRQDSAGDAVMIAKDKSRPLIIADNHNGSQADPLPSSEQKQPAETSPKGSRPNSESDQKTQKKTLKPFRPSERIKADQAVDFPSDI